MFRDIGKDVEMIEKMIYRCKMKEEEWRAVVNI